MTSPQTIGEVLFQDYLTLMKYPYEFEKEYPGRSKRPDFTVTKDGVNLFDVKDFQPYMPLGFGMFDPYPRIREKIDEGREKFREFKEFPCSVVLKNNGNTFVHLEDSHVMLGSMYGDSGFTFPVDTTLGRAVGPPTPAFLGRGKMIRATNTQNTTISALITLRHIAVGTRRLRRIWREFPNLSIEEAVEEATKRFPEFDLDEKQLGVIVWENAVARIPLSRSLFNGPFDERWGYENEYQGIVFRGEQLTELTEGTD